jgi:hypothetical protein
MPKVRSECIKCVITLCTPKLLHGLPHNGQLLEYLFIHPSYKQVKSQTKYEYKKLKIYKFLEAFLLNYTMRIFMAFLRHTEQCLLPFPPSVIYFTNLSFLVPEIFTYFEKHLQNLNTHNRN